MVKVNCVRNTVVFFYTRNMNACYIAH